MTSTISKKLGRVVINKILFPVAIILSLICPSNTIADPSADPSADTTAKETVEPQTALRYSTDSSWYSYESDKLVFPEPSSMDATAKKLANRHDSIVKKIEPVPSSVNYRSNFLDDLLDWLGEIFSSVSFQRVLFIVGCVVLVCLVFFFLRRLEAEGYGFRKKLGKFRNDNTRRDQARVVDLPFLIQDLKTDLFSEVLRLRDAKDFSQAIVYLFGHILVELDAANCIHLQRGKTNRIYLRELRDKPPLRDLFGHLVDGFESVFFGRHTMEREQFYTAFHAATEMKKLLAANRTPLDMQTDEQQSKSMKGGKIAVTDTSLIISIAILSGLGFSSGCESRNLNSEQLYGEASVSGAKKSVTGLSVFRSMCEQQGQTSAQLNGLSDRNKQLDTIVFAPKTIRTPTQEEIKWFEEWLSKDSRRRLILIGRDFSPTARYWNRAVESSAALDRVTYENQKAIAETAHTELRWNRVAFSECDWFKMILRPASLSDSNNVKGPWEETIKSGEFNAPLRGYFEPKSEVTVTDFSGDFSESSDTAEPDESLSGSAVEGVAESFNRKETTKEYAVENLLESNDGRPIFFSIESKKWPQGKIYVFTNGAILLNEGLTYSGHRKVANRLISLLPEKGRIGFLSPTDETFIRSDTDKQEASGFELLRVWPLSLISMQALFIGFIVLLALFPIFGRPQKPIHESTADFGLHIEALGKLLQRSQDKSYALHKIATYFRDVRKEPNSPWSQIAPPSKEFPHDRVVSENDRTRQD